MKKVKIYGAGSIGNHLAHASRQMGWSVDICDIDPDALSRTKNDIYPGRYGEWDNTINLYQCDEVPVGDYDLIVIGTPPDSHMSLARAAVKDGAKAVLVEKPLCTPDLQGAQDLYDEALNAGCLVFIGYDHAVAKSTRRMTDMLRYMAVGKLQTLDVEFREYWGGIFMAHPWLEGPADTYLGYWKKGGGACGEHSHAINLWQSFAHEAGIGRIVEVSSTMEFVKDGVVDYDSICLIQVRTENGTIGRVVQDIITQPSRKWARAQCEDGYVEWFCGTKPGMDTVVCAANDGEVSTIDIVKTRPDDFLQEMKHIEACMASKEKDSPISLVRGLETMLIIAAAHLSEKEKCPVSIDYSHGYTNNSLTLMK
jgi:predicted dehydrogenase